MKTFKEWCEDNGRRWKPAPPEDEDDPLYNALFAWINSEEFEKNAKDYEEYRREVEGQDEHERYCLNRVAPL